MALNEELALKRRCGEMAGADCAKEVSTILCFPDYPVHDGLCLPQDGWNLLEWHVCEDLIPYQRAGLCLLFRDGLCDFIAEELACKQNDQILVCLNLSMPGWRSGYLLRCAW